MASAGPVQKLAIDGGSPVRTEPFKRPWIFDDEERRLLMEVIDNAQAQRWGSDFKPELPISSCLGPSNAPSSTRAIIVSVTDAVNHPIKLTKPSLGVVS